MDVRGNRRALPQPTDGPDWTECCLRSFSPDDRFFAITPSSQANTTRIHLVDTESLRIAMTIERPYFGNVAWSPDGRWLFVRRTRTTALRSTPRSGNELELGFNGQNGVAADQPTP